MKAKYSRFSRITILFLVVFSLLQNAYAYPAPSPSAETRVTRLAEKYESYRKERGRLAIGLGGVLALSSLALGIDRGAYGLAGGLAITGLGVQQYYTQSGIEVAYADIQNIQGSSEAAIRKRESMAALALSREAEAAFSDRIVYLRKSALVSLGIGAWAGAEVGLYYGVLFIWGGLKPTPIENEYREYKNSVEATNESKS